MKKKLEAELISIAHRVLKLKNKSEVDILLFETRKIYEALSVLKFYNTNFEELNKVISENELNSKLEASFDLDVEKIESTQTLTDPIVQEVVNEIISESETVLQNEILQEEIIEIKEEKSTLNDKKDILDFEPLFEMMSETSSEEPLEEKEQVKQAKKISLEDLIGETYTEYDFVKPTENIPKVEDKIKIEENLPVIETVKTEKPSRGIVISLNDRVGFEVHLFKGNSDDYNRVLSQLNTLDSYEEAKDFIDNMVKPDYNNWEGQEYYSIRFMEIIENKFA